MHRYLGRHLLSPRYWKDATMGVTMTDAKRRILSRLADEPRHGYALAKEFSVQGSTMYEHLNELDEAGYVECEEVGRRNVYRVTEKGALVVRAEEM